MVAIDNTHTAVIVVWYNPDLSDRDTVMQYRGHVRCIYVVDNSDHDNSKLLQDPSIVPDTECNVVYIPLHHNTGIATALNTGCRRAIEDGADWIMTMDQDSRWDINEIEDYYAAANQYLLTHEKAADAHTVGIFAAYPNCGKALSPQKLLKRGIYQNRHEDITSGNIVRATVFTESGGYRDDYFIDLVDTEYCFRLRKMGYDIIRINTISFHHTVGEIPHRIVSWSRKTYSAHEPWRYYYIARNICTTRKLYPEENRFLRTQIRTYLKRLFLYDWDRKISKLKYFFRGWRDAQQGILGPMPQE